MAADTTHLPDVEMDEAINWFPGMTAMSNDLADAE